MSPIIRMGALTLIELFKMAKWQPSHVEPGPVEAKLMALIPKSIAVFFKLFGFAAPLELLRQLLRDDEPREADRQLLLAEEWTDSDRQLLRQLSPGNEDSELVPDGSRKLRGQLI